MSEWIYFLHPPRDDFAATMTEEEGAAWQRHFEWVEGLFQEGSLLMVGATGGRTNTGIGVFEAPTEEAAREVVSKDPAAAGGFAQGELRPFDLGLMRGRDG
ncbi:MAG: YciI family protein [Actinomycetota bacterium]|nr:YciI family protein [Actinomycetota bacterium]